MGLPQLLACLDVEKRHGKENHGEQQHHNILHRGSLSFSRDRTEPNLRRFSGLLTAAGFNPLPRQQANQAPCSKTILASLSFEY